MKSLFIALVVFLELAGCHTDLNPGRCNSSSDCSTGQTCDLTQNGVCVCSSPGCTDGGGTGGAATSGTGGGAATGGSAGTTDGGGKDSSDASHACQSRSDCSAPTPACDSTGACVQCNVSTVTTDCLDPTKPICDPGTSTCVACASDTQCAARYGTDPGVCMSQQDGHCATPAETIYVTNDSSICVPAGTIVATNDSGTGTVTKPLCSMEQVPTLLETTPIIRDLVVVRGAVQGGSWTSSGSAPLTIVGQATGAIAGGASPGFNMSSGSVYVRDLEITASNSTALKVTGGAIVLNNVTLDKSDDGIDVGGGSVSLSNSTISGESVVGIEGKGGTLTLSRTTIRNCMGGGILLEGAAFDIENVTVTSSGPSGDGSLGGIRIQSLPSTGPAILSFVTADNNNPTGVSCSTSVQGTAVSASGNISADITPVCSFSSCGTASTTCGAQ